MKLIKLIPLFFLSLNTLVMAAQNNLDSDWDIHCDEEECTPRTNDTKKYSKRFVDFSSYTYHKITREIKNRHPKIGFFLGPFINKQGEAQSIPIEGCIGDSLSVTNPHTTGGMIGLTAYMDSLEFELDNYTLKYTASAFYFASTQVNGNVTQEELVTNLEYEYELTNVAAYIGARLINLLDGRRCNLTFDAGVGINQINADLFIEKPKVWYALADLGFQGKNTYNLSYTLGAGFQIQNVFGKGPLGCGYRFFYLGEGEINSTNPQIPATLKTGKTYANAILCSIQLG